MGLSRLQQPCPRHSWACQACSRCGKHHCLSFLYATPACSTHSAPATAGDRESTQLAGVHVVLHVCQGQVQLKTTKCQSLRHHICILETITVTSPGRHPSLSFRSGLIASSGYARVTAATGG